MKKHSIIGALALALTGAGAGSVAADAQSRGALTQIARFDHQVTGVTAVAIVPDAQGNLCVVDAGAPGKEKILEGAPKLVKIDLAADHVVRTIPVPGYVAFQGTYL